MDAISRRAARVLLVDGAGRILLFHGFDPARPAHRYWFTVGGGLEPDEPAEVGAARELAEETGLRVTAAQLGDPVWRELTEYPFDGQWYRQEQDFFLIQVPTWDVDTDGFDAVERDSIDGHRWWTIEELESTAERIYPGDLADLLRRLIRGESGAEAPGGGPGVGPPGTPGVGASGSPGVGPPGGGSGAGAPGASGESNTPPVEGGV